MKTLILTVSAGNGHNSTAKRMKDKIINENKNDEVKIIDVYKSFAPKLQQWIVKDGYELVCNKAVGLYNYFFKIHERFPFEKRNKFSIHKNIHCILPGILHEIYTYKPDIIIATHVFCAIALADLKRYYEIPAKTICMTLDYALSPFWECCPSGLDVMFLTGEYMIEKFKKIGYSEKQLIVSGIPVAESFAENKEQKEARKELQLDEDLFTLIVMKASFFPIKPQKLFKEFKKLNKKIQIIIVNGNNPKEKNKFDRLIKKFNLQHNIINLGFTDKISAYFKACNLVLGKAGGLTTTETLNSELPSIIIDKLPQQEKYNRDFLVNNNCALSVNKNTIAQNINLIINDSKKYNKLKDALRKLKKHDSLNIMYKTILSFPSADYSKISFNDSNKQIIKNSARALKNAK